MVYPKVVLLYENEMRRDFAETVWNHVNTEGADLKMIPSIGEQRAFVEDMFNRRHIVEVRTEDVDGDWTLKEMVSLE